MLLRERVRLHSGDCLVVLDTMAENSIDAVVTDPPYELGFMGRAWDASGIAFCPQTWAKVLRVMKPGAHLVAFGAPKNYHRLACAIEDAGFEVRDSLMWVFGSGFPKSLDVSKAIDKAAGAERTECLGPKPGHEDFAYRKSRGHLSKPDSNEGWRRPWMDREDADRYSFQFAPATDAARDWQGWGTALKPAYEPIILARKPLSEKTVAANVQRWGTGAINIGATRIGTSDNLNGGAYSSGSKDLSKATSYATGVNAGEYVQPAGRWPANLCHDGSDEVLAGFPQSKGQQGVVTGDEPSSKTNAVYGQFNGRPATSPRGDKGLAARFFYCAKASKSDRAGSKHPTVKPVALMRWLCRMITPPNGVILDPFGGSGTTGQAAYEEGFEAVLIEREAEYAADIERRMESVGLV